MLFLDPSVFLFPVVWSKFSKNGKKEIPYLYFSSYILMLSLLSKSNSNPESLQMPKKHSPTLPIPFSSYEQHIINSIAEIILV